MMQTNIMQWNVGTVIALVALGCAIIPHVLLASISPDLGISPAVIDEKGKPRDILQETITLTNTSKRMLVLYPSVYDVNTVNGQEVFSYAKDATDLGTSLANWIELSRGVIEIRPGESRQVPFVVRIHMNAKAGQYHAQVVFSEGTTREEAEAAKSIASVSFNLELLADIKEEVQLNSFSSDNVVLAGDDVVFAYKLENIGNQDLQPTGEIRIYNRRGEEVASVEVNKSGKVLQPSMSAQLASVWNGAEGFGKFKALLTVNYGKGQTASVQDTVFFWVIPWKQLLGLIAATLIAIAFFALHFHRWFEERHFDKLARQGLIKTAHVHGVPDVNAQNVQREQHGGTSNTAPPKAPRGSWLRVVKTRALPISSLPAFDVFHNYKNGQKNKPEPVVESGDAILEKPKPVQSNPSQPSISLRVPAANQSATINLKQRQNLQAHLKPETLDGHVINLKRKS